LPTTSDIVSSLRFSLGDEKTKIINIVDESLGLANGTAQEIFYTKNMPVVAGYNTYLRIDRWLYSLALTESAASGNRSYLFSVPSGSFMVPTDAVSATSGNKVFVSYTYEKEQRYQHQDNELYLYVEDALDWIQEKRDLSLVGSETGTGYTITPTPTNFQAMLIQMGAHYLLRKDMQDKGFKDGIMLKELDITIDTTKTNRSIRFSTQELGKMLLDTVYALNLKDQATAAGIVDTYSTYTTAQTDIVGTDYEINESDGPFNLGEGNE
jgi:hypothetical protein